MYIMSNGRQARWGYYAGLLRLLLASLLPRLRSRSKGRIDACAGWRIAGNYLVSPHGDRMTPERLRGLTWRDQMELRLAGYASRRKAEAGQRGRQYGPKVKVIVVDLDDWRDRHFGRAG